MIDALHFAFELRYHIFDQIRRIETVTQCFMHAEGMQRRRARSRPDPRLTSGDRVTTRATAGSRSSGRAWHHLWRASVCRLSELHRVSARIAAVDDYVGTIAPRERHTDHCDAIIPTRILNSTPRCACRR